MDSAENNDNESVIKIAPKRIVIFFVGLLFFQANSFLIWYNMRIVVERESENRLSIRVWEIWFRIHINRISIFLDRYYEQSRPTTRHKYRIDRKWVRTDQRYNNWSDEEVEEFLTQDIIQEAKEEIKKVIDDIKVEI